MSTRSRARSRRTYHHGNLRAALIDAATRQLDAGGPQGVTLRGAAREAGVSQTAPYRHFPDKRAMLAALAEEGFRGMARVTARAAGRARGDPLLALQRIGAAYVRFAAERPSHYRLMFSPTVSGRSHPSLREAALAAWRVLCEAVAAAQGTGCVRAGKPEAIAFVLWALLHGLSALAMDDQVPPVVRESLSPEDLAKYATQMVLDGLAQERRRAQ